MEPSEPTSWPELPSELADHIARHLRPNEVACTFRLINKAAASQFRDQQHTTIHLSQPVPSHAFARHWLNPGATRGLSLKQRHKLLCLTAASGSVPNLEVAMQGAGCVPTMLQMYEAAAAAGSLDACQWLHQRRYMLGCLNSEERGKVLASAAAGGHINVCTWLLSLNLPTSWGAEVAAAANGHIAVMEWPLQRRPQRGYQGVFLMTAVARGCDLPTLQHLWLRWREIPQAEKASVLAAAAGGPTPDWAAKVEWLEGQGCPRVQAAAAKATARPVALERLTWLRGRGYPLGRAAVEAAAKSGNTAALQYLLGEGVRPQPGCTNAAMRAAEGGHLPVLQALHAAGWPMGGRCALEAAVEAGHLHVVAWLVETLGAAFNTELFAVAAATGGVELMAWLRQHGCEWDAEAINGAAEGGCEEALEWLVVQGCPLPADGRPYVTACRQGDLATPRCLLRLGVPWGRSNKVVQEAIRAETPLPTLRWLLEAGCPLEHGAADAAVTFLEVWPASREYAGEVVKLLRWHRQLRE